MPASRHIPSPIAHQSIDIPFGPRFVHRVRFTSDAFAPHNRTLADVLETSPDRATRVLSMVDQGVLAAWPQVPAQIASYLATLPHAAPVASVIPVIGGETIKNDRTHLDGVINAISEAGLCRRSYVIAIGGGAVLDTVGLAAALAHRGVRLIRIPTTTLAQADSGVAVKCGINAFGKKNYLGAFAAPWAVINDERLLSSLSDRDWRGGFAEAVKVALVKDASLFTDIETLAPRIADRDHAAAVGIIRRSALHHLRHITDGGDAFEVAEARPLDFGHWAAHRLESLTHYSIRHGEAVAIGIAIDAAYAHFAGFLAESDAARIHRVLRSLGFNLHHAALHRPVEILAGLDEFREHLGGRLTIVMPAGIGRSADVHTIDRAMMTDAILSLAHDAPTQTHPARDFDLAAS